jgi:hypothetical protein
VTDTAAHVRLADWRLAGVLSAVLGLFFVFGLLVFQPWKPEVPLRNDFVSFWTGAQLVRDGAGPALFDPETQSRLQAQLRLALTGSEEMKQGVVLDPFHSPPIQGLLFVPLTFLPLSLAYLVWSSISLVAFILAIALPLRGCARGATAAVVMLSFAGVADTLIFGQVNAIFLLGISLGLLSFSGGRPFLGGVLLGVLWLKPQYAVLFPLVFLAKRRWAELAGMAVAGAVAVIVSVAIVGLDGVSRYVEMMREIGAFYPPADSFIFPQSMVNWRGVLMNLWPGIPGETGSVLMLVLSVVTAMASLLVWRGPWEPASPRFARQVLVLTLAAILTSPHSNFHGMVLLLAPLGLTLSRPMEGETLNRVWGWLLVAGYTLSLAVWPVKSYSWSLVPLFLVTIGLLTVQCWSAPGHRPLGTTR